MEVVFDFSGLHLYCGLLLNLNIFSISHCYFFLCQLPVILCIVWEGFVFHIYLQNPLYIKHITLSLSDMQIGASVEPFSDDHKFKRSLEKSSVWNGIIWLNYAFSIRAAGCSLLILSPKLPVCEKSLDVKAGQAWFQSWRCLSGQIIGPYKSPLFFWATGILLALFWEMKSYIFLPFPYPSNMCCYINVYTHVYFVSLRSVHVSLHL